MNIKFRVWDFENNVFHYFELDNVPSRDVFNLRESQQFTVLRDANDKEIYEGDILEGVGLYNFDGKFRGDVRYVPCRFQCFVKYPQGGFGGVILDSLEVAEHQITVIGNIYENPELLK